MAAMRSIGYNSQRQNFNFAGKFPGWAQCFSTSAWMLMSFYSRKIKAADDDGLAKYVDDVEATVGAPGIGEKMKLKYNWIKGRTSLWWLTHKDAITDYLHQSGVRGTCQFNDGNFPIYSLQAILKSGPVIIGTNKLGGLPGGHIILLVDYAYKTGAYIVNDPYGDATTGYREQDGEGVLYDADWLAKYITVQPAACRCMFWNKI